MAGSIIPRVERGRLYFQTADVLFPTFAQAAGAWSAAEAHRLDMAAGSGEPAERAAPDGHSGGSSAIPADTPIAPVIVGGVDVAPLAVAARILRMVADEMDEGASELPASVQAARRIVWEVFTDLEAVRARGAS